METKKPDTADAERENPQRLYSSIGQFIFVFSQLEFMIRHALAVALALNNDRFHAITSSYDFATLCNVTGNILCTIPGCTDEERAKLKALFDECKQINTKRVRIVHGTWFIGEEGLGAEHVSRQTLEPTIHYSRVADIDKATDQAAKLKSRIVSFLIGPRSSWPDYAAPVSP